MKPLWYGAHATWWMPLERDARRRYRDQLCVSVGQRLLVYEMPEFDVLGDNISYRLRIEFYEVPPYPCFGLSAEEFPRVHASRSRSFDDSPAGTPTVHRRAGEWRSPHRHGVDGALCMWYPLDPPDRRWIPDDGLLALIEMAHDHLFAERYHWLHDRWPLEEAPHNPVKAA